MTCFVCDAAATAREINWPSQPADRNTICPKCYVVALKISQSVSAARMAVGIVPARRPVVDRARMTVPEAAQFAVEQGLLP